jgi:mannose-6-phosphate isomerase
MSFNVEPFQQRIEKPWGYEIIYTPEGLAYTGKILMVKKGKKLSFQYHDQKIETLCLFSGHALVWLEDETGEIQKIPMEPFQGYTVEVGQKHRVEAIEDSFILESSLPETGNTIRVEDDYARPDETESLRQEKDRGWQG